MSDEQNKPGFTPGPWSITSRVRISCGDLRDVDGRTVRDSRGTMLFHLPYAGRITTPPTIADADAHLIAVAPELYDFVATLENDTGAIPDWLWEKRNALLAKARGEVQP